MSLRVVVPEPLAVTPSARVLPAELDSVGVAEAGPPLTASRTVSVSSPLPTALAKRSSPLVGRVVKLAGSERLSDAIDDALPLAPVARPGREISTLPLPWALTAVSSADAVPSLRVIEPATVRSTIAPLAPVVLTSD